MADFTFAIPLARDDLLVRTERWGNCEVFLPSRCKSIQIFSTPMEKDASLTEHFASGTIMSLRISPQSAISSPSCRYESLEVVLVSRQWKFVF